MGEIVSTEIHAAEAQEGEVRLFYIRQLPDIAEKLEEIRPSIEQRLANARAMVCAEESRKDIKELRAALNREFSAYEDSRKRVKRAILEPYETFEATYRECVASLYRDADRELAAKISEVEDGIKAEKADEVVRYFLEYSESKNIDFVTFDMTRVKVTLSASIRSLKEQIKTFVDGVSDALVVIRAQPTDTQDEILVEYKKTLNVAQAISAVQSRHEAVRREQEARSVAAEREAETQKAVDAVNAALPGTEHAVEDNVLSAPAVAERTLVARFEVRGTASRLKVLKEFLESEGYQWQAVKR